MTGQTIAFYAIATILVFGALYIVLSKNIMRAVFMHLFTMVMIAGIYILLNAEFLAAMQVLVYAGAVTTMIVFALMLAGNQDSPTGGVSLDNTAKISALLVSGGLFATVVFATAAQKWPSVEQAAGQAAPSIAAIGRIIFSRYVLPFEVIGFLLLAALIGVIVVAGREE